MKNIKNFFNDIFIVLKIFNFQKKYKYLYLIATILYSFSYLQILIIPIIYKKIINSISFGLNFDISDLKYEIIFLCISLPLSSIGKYLRNIACINGFYNLQNKILNTIIYSNYEKTENINSGEYISKINIDAEYVSNVFQSFGIDCLFHFLIVFSIGVVQIFMKDIFIGIFVSIYCLILLIVSIIWNSNNTYLENDARNSMDKQADLFLESLNNIFLVKIFSLKNKLMNSYNINNELIRKKRVKLLKNIGIAYGVIDFFVYALPIFFYIFYVIFNSNITYDVSDIIYIASIISILGKATLYGGNFIFTMIRAFVSARRINEIISL